MIVPRGECRWSISTSSMYPLWSACGFIPELLNSMYLNFLFYFSSAEILASFAPYCVLWYSWIYVLTCVMNFLSSCCWTCFTFCLLVLDQWLCSKTRSVKLLLKMSQYVLVLAECFGLMWLSVHSTIYVRSTRDQTNSSCRIGFV